MVKTLNPITTKLLKFGISVAVILPHQAAAVCGFKAGSFVRVIVLQDEIRIRHVTALRAYDLETLEEYRERVAKQEAPARWE
jgi:antitoxin component of MazEF toxin-antitoxin module